MDLFNSMKVSGTGLNSNRTKINVISENLANSETTKTKTGGPYVRKMVALMPAEIEKEKSFQELFKENLDKVNVNFNIEENQNKKNKSLLKDNSTGVEVTRIVKSQEDFRLVYNPSHPDADPVTGYVAMPNVDVLTEMADMVVARRAYDANVTAISNAKAMISKALEIGR